MVAQTCGCAEKNIEFADRDHPLKIFHINSNDKIIEEMISISDYGTSEDNQQMVKDLFFTFIDESKQKIKNRFLIKFDTILRKTNEEDFEIIPDDIWPKNNTYNFFSRLISSGLQGTLLIKQINEHPKILESGINDLTGSIEQMVKNIEGITANMIGQENGSGEILKSTHTLVNILKIL